MDEVEEQFQKTKKEWDESYAKTQNHINSIQHHGKSKESSTPTATNSLPRLNGLAQDGLAFLNSLQFKLDLLAPQPPPLIKLRPLRLCFNLGKIKSKGCD